MKEYLPRLTVSTNRKGVLDIDTVKGCYHGMSKYPNGGCYGVCYACKMAKARGYDFCKSVIRHVKNKDKRVIEKTLKDHKLNWFRIGVMGDPSYSWENTISVCQWLGSIKTPVIVTKHWKELTHRQLNEINKCGAIIHTSISPLDSEEEIELRLYMFNKLKKYGVKSVLRVVSVCPGDTDIGRIYDKRQANIFKNRPIIDNPLRVPKNNNMVVSGDIKVIDKKDLGGLVSVSLKNKSAFIGKCSICPDQCGVEFNKIKLGGLNMCKNDNSLDTQLVDNCDGLQMGLFTDVIEFEYVKSVIGSGYENDVAKLAIEDGVAYRAARKNMQIHSAIILKINSEFSGFFTFQVNHEANEFCLLQSAMSKGKEDKRIYSQMVGKIIEQNVYGYPMIMTVSTKHPLECPKVFEAIGFKTYLELSGFAYMVYGTWDQIRMKRLAHATMTNTWTSTKADWLKMKKEWNQKIEDAGEKYNIPNPKFASRDGCWQGSNGFSNIVLSTKKVEDGEVVHKKGKSFNGNASVLDPVACEVILRFFMPTEGKRVYNPFGGGVQFGFVAGSYGYEYIASEIRQNQCDCNNALCHDFNSAKWIRSDSSQYHPDGMFDLVFSCPPYYKVEKYIDYQGVIPDGEINSMQSYQEFRSALFSGYKIAIEHLKENRFFVIMTGDSRDKNGAYYGSESETELFMIENGLSLYNKIVYLECEFTRLAQAKKTLDYRKFPKREQKIIVGYKGDIGMIKTLFPPIGRL